MSLIKCVIFTYSRLILKITTGHASGRFSLAEKGAFKKTGESAIQYYSNGGNLANGGNGHSSSGFGREFTSEDVAFVEKMILSCSQIKSEDSDIGIILIEEMPAYFFGQKVLDGAENLMYNYDTNNSTNSFADKEVLGYA
ncbi:MAG: hypothetical protein SPL61_00890 [Saccharofermentans sp.]|nr:hypothetical protein [Saccharofermentans sp.]